MAATLLYLLNSGRIDASYRNKITANVVMSAAVLVFVGVAAQEIYGLF